MSARRCSHPPRGTRRAPTTRSTAPARNWARRCRSRTLWPTTCPPRRRRRGSPAGASARRSRARARRRHRLTGPPRSGTARDRLRAAKQGRSDGVVAASRPRPQTARKRFQPPNRLPPNSEESSVLILIAIGFVAGIVTALSPCVLPVLPIVLAGGATGRRPLAIIAGIVVSFTVFTLFAAWLLDLVGLP